LKTEQGFNSQSTTGTHISVAMDTLA